MNIVVTGRGKAGSWLIRGEQLGRAAGADVMPMAIDVARYDVVVLVKGARGDLVNRIHAGGAALVWDIVDAWPQPEGNLWGRAECLSWLREQIRILRPQAVIAATRRQADDVAEVCGKSLPVRAIHHHFRPGLKRTEIRERIGVVAYEGSLRHLGVWRERLERVCRLRGADVVINPASLTDADVVVALREADGYAARNWKSNVKLANAQGSGTPVICVPESGYLETAGTAFPLWAETDLDLLQALDHLAPRETRQAYSDALFANRIKLATVAREYREFLEAACCPARSF
jgi:hypothetical protein